MKHIIKSRLFSDTIFTIIFIALFFTFGLNKTISEPPQSVHIWRQTNSLSIAHNYYQDNLPFLEPEIHNQFPDGGHSGKAVGECPFIYYFVAQLWKIFGNEEWIFRLVHLIIIFSGLYLLFHSLQILFKNRFWAGFTALLLFTSPMMVFYGPNFLPDGPALAFIFVAWYFILKFKENRKTGFLWISGLFFLLAILLKITSALSYIALGGWVLYELLFMKKSRRTFDFKPIHFVPFILVIPVIAGWYLYAGHYNKIHGGHFSYHGIWPVWEMTREQFTRIIDALDKIYFKEMFLPYTQYLTLIIWVFLVITIHKVKPIARYFLLVLPAGMAVQLILWFQVLEGHDYYMINLLIVFAATWAILFYRLKSSRILTHPLTMLSGVLFFAWNIYTCQERINVRYEGWMNSMYADRMKTLVEIEPYFEEIRVSKNDKVISLPDFTINASLYYMNRKGYTEFSSDFTKAETFYNRIEQGAKFLVINDSTILQNEVIKPFTVFQIGKYKNISIYDLRNIKSETPQVLP